MFADQAKIYIRSGKGGDGHVSFRRELYVPNGGPDGGDGGRGGDLIFEVDPGINTLNEFRHIRKYCAEDGEPGGKRRCHGKDGADLVVKVPAGTIVKEANSGQVITDMSYDNTDDDYYDDYGDDDEDYTEDDEGTEDTIIRRKKMMRKKKTNASDDTNYTAWIIAAAGALVVLGGGVTLAVILIKRKKGAAK